jgi:hypothetical protein
MIRINLLPEHYRAERTSPRVFGAMLVAVVLTCSVFGWFGLLYFGDLRDLEKQHEAVSNTLATEAKTAMHYDRLVVDEKEFSKRSKTIQTIASSRMLWTEVLDEMIEMVNNNTDRHVAWFTNLDIKSGPPRGGPSVNMPGLVQGSKVTMVANFHEDLERTDFFQDVSDVSQPSAVRQVSKDRYPKEAYAFTLKWTFKPAKAWRKNQADARPGK